MNTRIAGERIPLNTFAIGFGLAGLAETWSVLGADLGWPWLYGQVLWIVAGIAWIWLIVAHTARGLRTDRRLVDQLRHPAQGPIAALVPVTGMLLGADLYDVLPAAGLVLVVLSTIASLVFGGWMIATWFEGRLELAAVHGGYLLPTVAAGLVGADTCMHVGLAAAAWLMLGIGVFFWAVMTTLLVLRLTVSPVLPDPLVPTMMILLAPPVVGGIAWFALAGHEASPVALSIAGLTILTVIMQITLIGRYRRLRFSLGFWSFTFPIAAFGVYTTMWLALLRFPGWQGVATVLAALISLFILAIAVRSLALIPRSRSAAAAEEALNHADDADARGQTRTLQRQE
ncbi:MAG: transporter [Actinobacteria bacterium]|nr:transporter [Actinomycetota bacterium]